MTDSSPSSQNVGHGHVFPRPDGLRMRCGGPRICSECAKDLARKKSEASFVCADCGNTFLQEPRCTTCGAEKLYDATVRNLQQDNARYESGRVVLTGEIDTLKLKAQQLALERDAMLEDIAALRMAQIEFCDLLGVDTDGDLHSRIVAGIKAWKAEVELTTRKIITCGVAASHPDANLSRTKAYGSKWDSPQAQEVRKLRDERDQLRMADRLPAAGRVLGEFWSVLGKDGELRNSPHLFSEKGQHCDSNAAELGHQVVRVEVRLMGGG